MDAGELHLLHCFDLKLLQAPFVAALDISFRSWSSNKSTFHCLLIRRHAAEKRCDATAFLVLTSKRYQWDQEFIIGTWTSSVCGFLSVLKIPLKVRYFCCGAAYWNPKRELHAAPGEPTLPAAVTNCLFWRFANLSGATVPPDWICTSSRVSVNAESNVHWPNSPQRGSGQTESITREEEIYGGSSALEPEYYLPDCI